MTFSDETIRRLKQPIDRSLVKTRRQGSTELSYLEGYQVIRLANDIFGFDGWDTGGVDVQPVKTGDGKIVYYATVSIVVGLVLKTDVGCGVPAGDKPEAHDTAIKGAVTDAMKRAFRQFGDQFGNSLYDKEENSRQAAASRTPTVRPTAVPAGPPVPCEEPGCTNQLKGYSSNKPGGQSYTAEQQAEQSRARFGKALCIEHMKAASAPPEAAG